MKPHKGKPIEALVLSALQGGTVSTGQLVRSIAAAREKTTKQGTYRVLRKLKSEEKIVIHGKSVSLNLQWIKAEAKFFSGAELHYSLDHSAAGPLNVGEGDRIVYYFKKLDLLDAFSVHAFHAFVGTINQREPIYVYNPHEWFAYARQETELGLLQDLTRGTRQILITLSHDNPLNRKVQREFGVGSIQCHVAGKQLFPKGNYYLNVFGDYILEAYLDQKISGQIDRFFAKTSALTDKTRAELVKIISQSGRNKLIISRNSRKAAKYKKVLSRYFFIPKVRSNAAKLNSLATRENH